MMITLPCTRGPLDGPATVFTVGMPSKLPEAVVCGESWLLSAAILCFALSDMLKLIAESRYDIPLTMIRVRRILLTRTRCFLFDHLAIVTCTSSQFIEFGVGRWRRGVSPNKCRGSRRSYRGPYRPSKPQLTQYRYRSGQQRADHVTVDTPIFGMESCKLQSLT
jgi:hypothetical protein